jgi:leader peptidase (prepilin peptidase)/N-methyltransferase
MYVVEILRETSWLLVSAAVLLGLVAGSFLNVVIHRLPRMLAREWREQAAEVLSEWAQESSAPAEARALRGGLERLAALVREAPRYDLAAPRSSCPSCGHRIRAIENVPVLSYLALGGRCSACRAPIPVRYPLVEALAAALAGYAAWRFGWSAALPAALLFVWAMIALAFIDLDTSYLPDDITQPLLWAGLVLAAAGIFTDLPSAVLGAVFGYLAFWSVAKLWGALRKVESMGHGDFKLLAALGAWFGWQMLPLVVLVSTALGAAVGLVLMAAGRGDLSTRIPFGPYLAIAGVIALLHGDAINQHYLRLWS